MNNEQEIIMAEQNLESASLMIIGLLMAVVYVLIF